MLVEGPSGKKERQKKHRLPCRPDEIKNSKCFSWTSQSISCRSPFLKKVSDGTWMPPGKASFGVERPFVTVIVVVDVYSAEIWMRARMNCPQLLASRDWPLHREYS